MFVLLILSHDRRRVVYLNVTGPSDIRVDAAANPRSLPRRHCTASALPDSGFSFAGLRPRSNSLTIDGLDNNDQYSGASRTELSLETVREFQVVNNGWSAESGGASGGSVNVVTKSGTNTIQARRCPARSRHFGAP